MQKTHYYGKKTRFVGKTLFEILANLRNYGLNRMLIKNDETILRNPGKPSYYIVKKVEPVMDEKLQEGAIYAERVFKGAKFPGLVFVNEESWHTDWQLVPKHEESKYLVENPPLYAPPKVIDKPLTLPPLMDAFLKSHLKNKGQPVPEERIKIPMEYEPNEINNDIDVSKPISLMLAERFRRNNKQ